MRTAAFGMACAAAGEGDEGGVIFLGGEERDGFSGGFPRLCAGAPSVGVDVQSDFAELRDDEAEGVGFPWAEEGIGHGALAAKGNEFPAG